MAPSAWRYTSRACCTAVLLLRAMSVPSMGLPPPTLVVSAKPDDARARTKLPRVPLLPPSAMAAARSAVCSSAAETSTGR